VSLASGVAGAQAVTAKAASNSRLNEPYAGVLTEGMWQGVCWARQAPAS
jgi:hypothetical protein